MMRTRFVDPNFYLVLIWLREVRMVELWKTREVLPIHPISYTHFLLSRSGRQYQQPPIQSGHAAAQGRIGRKAQFAF